MNRQWSRQRWEKGSRYYEVLLHQDLWGDFECGADAGRSSGERCIPLAPLIAMPAIGSSRSPCGETHLGDRRTAQKWMGLKVPGDTMVFWWPTGTDPDTYDADHGRAMDMGIARYT